MPYCNVWAEVVCCGFPKSKVFTKLKYAYSLRATKVYISTKFHMWTLVSEFCEFNHAEEEEEEKKKKIKKKKKKKKKKKRRRRR